MNVEDKEEEYRLLDKARYNRKKKGNVRLVLGRKLKEKEIVK